MIRTFENQTYHLTDFEVNVMVPRLAHRLRRAAGAEKAVKSRELIEYLHPFALAAPKPLNVTGPRIRKYINYIRRKELLQGVVATSRGYFLSDDPIVLLRYVDSIKDRISAILVGVNPIKKHLRELLKKEAA